MAPENIKKGQEGLYDKKTNFKISFSTTVPLILMGHSLSQKSLIMALEAVFRIRLDPDSNCQIRIRILKVKLSYKNPLFPQIFNDFHLFFKMIRYQIKVLFLMK